MPPKKSKPQTSDVNVGTDDVSKEDNPLEGAFGVILQEILTTVRTNGDKITGNSAKLTELESKYDELHTTQEATSSRLDAVEHCNNVVLDAFIQQQDAFRSMEITSIRSEENTKRFNVIIYNLSQTEEHESRNNSIAKVQDVLAGLDIDPDNINIVEAHRLPTKTGVGRKPLIFKLSSMQHKDVIWNHLKNLDALNATKRDGDKIKINMTHLPKKLAKDREDLFETYNDLKDDGKNPKWRYVKSTGDYCIKVNNRLIRSPNDNFTSRKIKDPRPSASVVNSPDTGEFV